MSAMQQALVSRSKPVRALAAVAGGSVVVASGLPILTPDRLDWIGPAVGLLGLAITAGLAKWTEGQVTPWEDVAAKVTPAGNIVAGPAAEGIVNGRRVSVQPDYPGAPGREDEARTVL